MMNRAIFTIFVTVVGFLMFLASCDDGPVYGSAELKPENGLVLKLTGELSGTGRWNAGGYSLVVAGFDDSDYAVITKSVPQSVDGAAVTVVMSGIGESVTSLELCVINRLRRRVVTFASVSTISGDDTVRLPVGRMDVSVYSALQAGVLTPRVYSVTVAATMQRPGSTSPATVAASRLSTSLRLLSGMPCVYYPAMPMKASSTGLCQPT